MEEESRLVDATVLVDALTKEVKEACEAVEEEDNTREHYSLVESIDKVKLPSFEGRDFPKQKEFVERAFVKMMLHKTIVNEIERSMKRLC